MTFKRLSSRTVAALVVLILPLQLAAQHKHYKLIDLGTLGGPSSAIAPTDFGGPENPGRGLTNTSIIVGGAETTLPDPFAPNCANSDCLVAHAFVWKDGMLTDLGTNQDSSDSDLDNVAH